MDIDLGSFFLIFVKVDLLLITELTLLFLLLSFSALVSGAEVAFFSLSAVERSKADKSESKKHKMVAKLLDNPKRLLATILVSNNFINIAIILLSANILQQLLANWQPLFRFITEVVLVSFLILLFGEILPKVYASRNKIAFSVFMVLPLRFLDKLLWFLVAPLSGISSLLEARLIGKQKIKFSIDRLSQALALASEKDTTKEEKKILEGIVSFGNTDTRQVMRPRIDVFALSQEMSFEAIIPEIIKHGYSRVPIYQESMDKISGVLYIKDLLPHVDKTVFDWKQLIRKPYFVPENKKLDDLLKAFQEKKNHLAIVVDEYGGTSGIVTLKDIIEEIVGDISDEFDDEYLAYSKLDSKNYVFEGKTSLKDFYRILGINEDLFEKSKGESETIAGFLLEISGSFPRRGQKIIFHNYTFTIEALDKKRIKQIKASIL